MTSLRGLLAGLAIAGVIACGGANRAVMAPATAPEAGAAPTGIDGMDPRAEIERLDAEIDVALGSLSVPPPVPACAAEAACGQAMPATTAIAPRGAECQPAASQTCTDTCTLSDSICDNAGRICELAKQLGGADAFANEKCAKGNTSCEQARGRCCGCT